MSADLFDKIEQRLSPGRAQLLTILYVGIIYATLPIMRPILNFLKEHLGDSFSAIIYLCLLLVAVALLFLLVKQKSGWGPLLSLVGLLTTTAYILPRIKYPEERVHFLEYAILGILLYFVLREKIRGRKAFLYGSVIIFLVGLVDEIIQGILPNRVYQFTDVLMNLAGGILGELILITFHPELIRGEKGVFKA